MTIVGHTSESNPPPRPTLPVVPKYHADIYACPHFNDNWCDFCDFDGYYAKTYGKPTKHAYVSTDRIYCDVCGLPRWNARHTR